MSTGEKLLGILGIESIGNQLAQRFAEAERLETKVRVLTAIEENRAVRAARTANTHWDHYVTRERVLMAIEKSKVARNIRFLRAWRDYLQVDQQFARIGQKVYRIFGGDSRWSGASWSPVDPSSIPNYRGVAGLPSGGTSGVTNTGRFVVEGRIVDPYKVIKVRKALPLDGNEGGVLEYIIPDWSENGAILIERVSGANPEF
ncbi:MAG: hypothetical protein GXO69_05510 [Acidobacteria bacterium]|nr:hypothetical protein [Acidobacteriota bacterium]